MIAPMKKFYLFFSGEKDILKNIQKLGVVEIQKLPDEFGFSFSHKEEKEIETKLKKIEFLKNLIKKIEGKEFLGKILISEKQEKEVIEGFHLEEIFTKFNLLTNLIEKKEKSQKRIKNLLIEILPFENLDIIPYSLYEMKKFSFFFFSVGKKLSAKIEENLKKYFLEEIRIEKETTFYLVIFPNSEKNNVTEILTNVKAKIIFIRPFRKKIKEVIDKLNIAEEKIKKEKEKLLEEIKEILKYKTKIFVFSDYLKTVLNYINTHSYLANSKFVKGFSGWIKEKDVAFFEKFVNEKIPESYLFIKDPEENEPIPIALENKEIIKPFEIVVDLYGRPVYNNIDPTFFLSFFFVISFAFCLTDAGYGIILSLISVILMKKFTLYPNVKKFFKLLFYSGLTTIIIGGLTGGWFGNIHYRIPQNFILAKFLKKIELLNPMEGGNQAIIFLICGIILGYLQILYGLFINFFHSIKQYGIKKSQEQFVVCFIQLLIGILIVSLIVKLDIVFKIVLGLIGFNFIYLSFIKICSQKEFIMKIFWFFYGPYSVAADNLLAHPLSYSRLFGLGLTTSVLASVVNEIVFSTKNLPYIGFVLSCILFIIGHFLNLIINTFGGYIHTSRLQYLEFFTKFFEGGGKPFTPFSEVREYTFKISELEKGN